MKEATVALKRLGDICTIQPSKSEAREFLRPGDKVSFVPMDSLGILRKELGPTRDRVFSEVVDSYTYFANGDVLLAKITPCFENGKLGIASDLTNGIGFGSSEYIVLRPSADILGDFLYYYLLQDSFRRTAVKHMTGTAGQKRVTKTYVESCLVPVPPIHKQRRIVDMLGKALEGLDSVRANATINLRNAQAIFDSRLGALFSQEGKSWERLQLQALLERGWIVDHMDGNHGGDYPRKEEFVGEGVPYISANCMSNDKVDMLKAKYLSPERAAKLRKGFARNGDVLFAHNATVGPVAELDSTEPIVVLGTSLTYYRCNSAFIRPAYLAHYMRSHGFRRQYETVMRQSTRNQVPITKQREFYHVVPPVYEQDSIAAELDQLSADAGRLERIYQSKIKAFEEMRQALLNEAFFGTLR